MEISSTNHEVSKTVKNFIVNQVILSFLFILSPLFLFAGQQFNLSVCTIFQNETRFLKEWIEFHRIQGVEHFFLYNNNSDENMEDVLKEYVDKRLVTLIDWNIQSTNVHDWNRVQCASYMDCIERFGKKSKWIAFIDTDEFLFCPNGTKLTIFLKKYSKHAAIGVNWVMFGTSKIYEIPEEKTMIECLLRCAFKETYLGNLHVKSIVRPSRVLSCNNPHFFKLDGSFVNEDGKPINKAKSSVFSASKIRINHYWSRDEKFVYESKIPRREKWGNCAEDVWRSVIELNESEDHAILRFVPELRRRLGLANRFESFADQESN